MIELKNISKTFKIPIRKAGMKEAVKAFFVREYKEIKALDDVSFTINEGEIVGYIGPNGAGKSSTIKIMSGILKQDSGQCHVAGLDPFKDRKKHSKNLGVVFGQRSQLWWDIPIIDSYELLKDIYEIDEALYHQRLDELVELLKLESIIKMPARQLSLGQRMRCEVVASLLHNPKILFLDEPTIGLDAVSKIAIRQFIKEINQKFKTTIILTTHDMQDIESLVSRIILIGKGKILFDGSMEELKSRYTFHKKIKVSYSKGRILENKLYKIVEETSTQAVLLVSERISEVIELVSKSVEIDDIEIIGESIDDILLHLYEDFQL